MAAPINVAELAFKAAGATQSNTWRDRAGYILNAKLDFGFSPSASAASNDGNLDDALAEVFGDPSNPRGYAGRFDNKWLFVPEGDYQVSKEFLLKYVVGGRIFGNSAESTRIWRVNATSGHSLFRYNGVIKTHMKGLTLSISGASNNNRAITPDYDDAGGADMSLRDCEFEDLIITDADRGIVVGESGNGGQGFKYRGVGFVSMGDAGIDLVGAEATDQYVEGGGGVLCPRVYRAPSGGGGFGTIKNPSCALNDYDVDLQTEYRTKLDGGRSENPILTISAGTAVLSAVNQSSGLVYANIDGGKVIMDGCNSGVAGVLAAGEITGAGGKLFMRACNFYDNPDFLDNYSGEVLQNLGTDT